MNASAMSWGAGRKRAALSITFDNLGEAGEISLGLLPKDMPCGSHYTATEVLSRLLDLLTGVSITYFIEGINATIYPEQLHAIAAAGHEIGLHAWQHEGWNRLRGPVQEELLRRSLAAMAKAGIKPEGFRPPGGEASADALALLRQFGFAYCSPLGTHPSRVQDGLVVLPFRWRHVDAYLMDPVLGFFRAANGAVESPTAPEEWAQILDAGLSDAIEHGEHLTVIFHPYLFGRSADQWNVLERFLARARAHDDLWIAPCREVAAWMKTHATSAAASERPF
jgi:peptidoglycan/xylan/chitin deacetylase (PgdA/CDA1 family)